MKYGTFDVSGNPPAPGHLDDYNYIAQGVSFATLSPRLHFAGSVIYIFKSGNITVRDLEIDGNSDNHQLGGYWGDPAGIGGYQIETTGILIADSYDASVADMYIHHMGTDGIGVYDFLSTFDTYNIDLSNTNIQYSGRNGLSWMAGNNLTASNCNFSYTSKGAVKSFPKSGVDIETEAGRVPNTGTFINCTFDNNEVGLQSSGSPVPYDVDITNSRLAKNSRLQIQLYGSDNFVFTKCEFYGSSRIETETDDVVFDTCLFQNCFDSTEIDIDSVLTPAIYKYLLYDNAKTVSVSRCTFNSYNGANSFRAEASNCATADVTTINNSIFNIFNNSGHGLISGVPGAGVIVNNVNVNYKSTNPVSLATCSSGHAFTVNQFPGGFVVPGCLPFNCIPNLAITTNLYAPNFVYKASSKITASSIVDLSSTSSVANGYIKYAAQGAIDMQPGFKATISNTSFFDGFIKSCNDVTAFGRPDNRLNSNPASLVEQEIEKGNITIYPNPANGFINVVAKYELLNSTIQLFDINGKQQKILVSSISSKAKKISWAYLPNGLYFLKMTSKDKTSFGKIIISH